MRHAQQDTFTASFAALSRAEKIGLAKRLYTIALKELAAGAAVDPSAWRIANDMRKQLERLDVNV
ncbi:hypothetical protein ABLT15_01260 [Paraburkholderia tropica]|uniref:hypothetical protein n=1 Tax=Paraburkholderia tropica TaxID=92647 RepID=UPI0032B368CD